MTEQEIVDKVKAVLNEIGEEDSLSLLSEDTVKVEEYIRSAIPDAVALVQLNSPVRCVNKKIATIEKGTSEEDGRCVIPLPEDYVSLIVLKLASFKRACVTAYGMDSEEYKRQCNAYTRAGEKKPVCISGYGKSGEKVLWVYSAKPKTEFSVEMFVYEATYDPSSGLNLDSGDPVILSVCYMTASLVYLYFENKPMADELKVMAVSLIPKQ